MATAIGHITKEGKKIVVLQKTERMRAIVEINIDGSGVAKLQKREFVGGEWETVFEDEKSAKQMRETLLNEGVSNG